MCWSHQKVLGKVLTIFFFLIFFGEIMVECKQKITKGFVKLAVLIYKNKKKMGKEKVYSLQTGLHCQLCGTGISLSRRHLRQVWSLELIVIARVIILSYRQQEHHTKALIMISCLQVWRYGMVYTYPTPHPHPSLSPLLGITLNPSWPLLNCSIPIPKVSIALTVSSEYLFTDLRLNSLIPRND